MTGRQSSNHPTELEATKSHDIWPGPAKAKSSSSVHRSISHTVNRISRCPFKSKEIDDELGDGGQVPNIHDSAYGSKEDSLLEEVAT